MNYWLIKSEPSVWSFNDQKTAGLKTAILQLSSKIKSEKDKENLAASFQKQLMRF